MAPKKLISYKLKVLKMRKLDFIQACNLRAFSALLTLAFLLLSVNTIWSRSNINTETISGTVFIDSDYDGINNEHQGAMTVLVTLFDNSGNFVDRKLTSITGSFEFEGLQDKTEYQIHFDFDHSFILTTSKTQASTKSLTINAPATDVSVGVIEKSEFISEHYQTVKSHFATNNSSISTITLSAHTTFEKTSEKTDLISNVFLINEGLSYDEFIYYSDSKDAKNLWFQQWKAAAEQVESNSNDSGGVPFQNADNLVIDGSFESSNHNLSVVSVSDYADKQLGFAFLDYNLEAVDAKNSLDEFYDSNSLASTNTGWYLNKSNSITTSAFALISSEFDESCYCLSNATTDMAGEYVHIYFVLAGNGENWVIDSVDNAFNGIHNSDEEPNLNDYIIGDRIDGTELNVGDTLYEEDLGNGTSRYYIEYVSYEGEDYYLSLSSDLDESVVIDPVICSYNSQSISGEELVCGGGTFEYCVDYDNGNSYEWTLSEGGTVVGPANEQCVTVEWDVVDNNNGDEDDNIFELVLTQTDEELCLNPATLDVVVAAPGGAMTCLSFVNLSLGDNCEAVITQDLVLKHQIPENVEYEVIVIDPDGNMLPEPIINEDHVGLAMTVKVVDICSGNSCWSTVTVEDKMPPIFDPIDADTVVSCFALDLLVDPVAQDACAGELPSELISQDIISLECDDEYSFEITRTYTATDDYGNQSIPFVRTILLARVEIDSIQWPQDYSVQNNNPLYCQQYEVDENGNPNVSETGVPTYEGMDIYPYQDLYCDFGIQYTDEILSVSNCVTKVKRTWLALEWYCDQTDMAQHIQMISIVDGEDPVFEAPEDVTVTASVSECAADVLLPAVNPTDDCSDDFQIDIQYPGGFAEDTNGTIVNLPLGDHDIIYIVYDECKNSSTDTMHVSVVDNTPPVMVCEQNTVVSLNTNGEAYIYAETFDDGTVDDCSLDYLEVRRMDSGEACNLDNFTFGDQVDFCCADVGNPVSVILRAWDTYGNSNECMVNVIVQDKNPPAITCPGDMTINCDTPYDPEDLAALFGEATATDNCLVTDISVIENIDINSCNEGTITRLFIASDGNGVSQCLQTITVTNPDTFSVDNIIWPLDYETNECMAGLLPENLDPPYDFPIINDGFCDNISFTYEDKTYANNGSNGACFKIVRTWSVMDMCNPSGDDPFTIYNHAQLLKVTNDVDPVIVSDCSDIVKCVFDDCDNGQITLTASATDDCTPLDMLNWTYNIDLDSDGSFDITQSGVGQTISLTDSFDFGTHEIVYTFEDICGNQTSCTQAFTLYNCDLPVAYCQNITVGLTPMDTDGDGILDNEMATVDVNMIDAGSYHPCGDSIQLAFDSLNTITEVQYDCFDLGINIITLYVFNLNGDYSSCEATVEVQDNNDVDICPDPEDCIIWPDSTITILECVPDLDPGSIGSEAMVVDTCFCDEFTIEYVDTDESNPADACASINREWTITFTCYTNPLSYTFEQEILQFNAFAPIITSCASDVIDTAFTTDCEAFVNVELPTFDTTCTFGVTITNDSPFADSNIGDASGIYPVGTTLFKYTVINECGLASTCMVDITIIDGEGPTCMTQDISIILGDSGMITIAEDAVDNGSFDVCSNGNLTFDTEPDSFTCDNLGENVVIMTVTDSIGNSSSCEAIVTVTDTVAPICNAQDINYVIVTASDFYVITDPTIANDGSFDPCGSGELTYEIVPDTLTCDDIGIVDAQLIVTDEYGNSSQCGFEIIVSDVVNPTCVVQDITISIDSDGETVIDPLDLDFGSFDDCGEIVSYTVTPDTFDCDNIGDNPVVFVVTDNSGNISSCNAVVTVESADSIECNAQDLTVYLDDFGNIDITADQVGGGTMAPCGSEITLEIDQSSFDCDDIATNPNIVTLTVIDVISNDTVTCTAEITVLDTLVPTISCPVDLTFSCDVDLTDEEIYGDLTFDDNCVGSVILDTTSIENLDICGLGSIERTYTIIDESGNEASCTQLITIEPGELFDESSIIWPVDTLEIADCTSIDPDSLMSFPEIDSSSFDCATLSINYMDSDTTFNCQDTISRTWTVIDSCQFDGAGNGEFTFTQVLIINDNQGPIIIGPMDTVVYSSANSCNVFIDLSNVTVVECNGFTGSNDSPFADDNMTLDASGSYELGITSIELEAIDDCGNVGTYNYTVTVLDTIVPDRDCQKIQPELTADGTVEVFPEDILIFVEDNCTAVEDLEITFITGWTEGDDPFDNPMFDSFIFDCDDLVDFNVTVLIVDESGNYRICISTIDILDPLGVCPSPPGFISGEIENEFETAVPNVEMFLSGNTNEYGTLTDEYGLYEFNNVAFGNYTLTPHLDEDLLAGVTTLDIVLIQKHILGLSELQGPYNLIAADINNSGNVSGADLVQLRKAILGLQDYFSNNTSFRFVDSEYTFPDPQDPFGVTFPESAYFNDVLEGIEQDFVGVKIGDVNGSYQPLTDGNIQTNIVSERLSDYPITLESEAKLTSGSIVSIPVYGSQVYNLNALNLKLQTTGLEIQSIESGVLPITEGDYRWNSIEEYIHILWVSKDDATIENDDVLFTIKAFVTDDISIEKAFEIDPLSEVVENLVVRSISLHGVTGMLDQVQSQLFQNNPNPWRNQTEITFYVPNDQKVTMKYYSIDGRELASQDIFAVAGYNEIVIQSTDIPHEGVIVYQLQTEKERITNRMLKVK